MAEKRLGIIMNGVTGRMGTNQHLIRSILNIMEQGGVELADGTRVMPDPILVGRNPEKLAALAKAHGVERWTADLDAAIANPDDELFFDTASTLKRAEVLHKAIAAGKHIYCEKPSASTLDEALGLWRAAEKAGIRRSDVIIEFDGFPIKNSRQLPSRVAHAPAGVPLAMKIVRSNKVMTLNVKLEETPKLEN